ncbi:Galactitol permease IIC component (plasmid) [Klebsiella pneumoniae]|nr:Galactitol permease IIC component [Klebsiella pneumoniae]
MNNSSTCRKVWPSRIRSRIHIFCSPTRLTGFTTGIPGFRNLNVTAESIQKRFGILGDPTMVGFIIGILLGFCGYSWESPYHTVIASLQLGMYLAAVMLLLPRMTSIMMEGLVPLSNVARKKLVKRFPDREITVGMDTALIVGHPSVIAPALLLIPVIVILAVILPGNRVMPLGDLSQFVFFIACMVPVSTAILSVPG